MKLHARLLYVFSIFCATAAQSDSHLTLQCKTSNDYYYFYIRHLDDGVAEVVTGNKDFHYLPARARVEERIEAFVYSAQGYNRMRAQIADFFGNDHVPIEYFFVNRTDGKLGVVEKFMGTPFFTWYDCVATTGADFDTVVQRANDFQENARRLHTESEAAKEQELIDNRKF